jgi:hypothetical protein
MLSVWRVVTYTGLLTPTLLLACLVSSCVNFAEQERKWAEDEQRFRQRFAMLEIGMSPPEAERILGGPPFRVEPTVTPTGTTEMRYYNALYLYSATRPGARLHQGAYDWQPGWPLVWLRFDNNKLTTYGMR